jgi:replication-associated recombination protein RarA
MITVSVAIQDRPANIVTLYEKYRPRTWAEVLGQPKALAKLDMIRKRCGTLSGRAYWIGGPSGTGKTTIAYLIAQELADNWFIEELDGTQVNAAWLNSLELTWGRMPIGDTNRRGRVFVINEAHGLSAFAVKRLLELMEGNKLPAHCCLIFTTTTDGLAEFKDGEMDASPFLSRCTQLALTSQGLSKVFARRGKEIAEIEHLDGQPIEKYERLAADEHNNMRAILSRIEEGCMVEEGAQKA